MRKVVALVALSGCMARPAPAPPEAPAGVRTTALLAAAVCEQLRERVFALASSGDDVRDLFVVVKDCTAEAKGTELAIAATAFAWMAVDRDLGAVSVREFVHVTLRTASVLRSRIRPVGDHVELELAVLPGARLDVTPVGSLSIEALNWASLLALELAPSAGASPEALAKEQLRRVAASAFQEAIRKPLAIAYDARTGSTWMPTPSRPAATAAARPVRIARGGMALVPAGTGAVHVHVRGDQRVAVRALCAAEAGRLLDADRRGERVTTDDWTVVRGDGALAPADESCTTSIAIRLVDGAPATVDVDVHGERPVVPGPPRVPRWVAIDAVDARRDIADVTLAFGSDSWRGELPLAQAVPILEVSAGRKLWVRAYREAYGAATVVAEGAILIDAPGSLDATVVLEASGRAIGRVHVRGRVRAGVE